MTQTNGEFPETLYVRIEEDGDEFYIIAGAEPAEIASDTGASYRTAKYVLASTGVVHNKPYFVSDDAPDAVVNLGADAA